MIIGLMFAAIYGAIYGFDGNTFFAQGAIGNSKTFQYFSFTTLTTLGYGDFTAANSGGRQSRWWKRWVGQIFLVPLVARLVAAFRSPQRAQHHEQPAQHPAPQNAPAERRRRLLLAGRRPGRCRRGEQPLRLVTGQNVDDHDVWR